MAGEKLEGLLPGDLRLLVENMALKEQRLPLEPALDKETGEVITEQEGCIVDIEGSVSKALQAEEGEKLELLMRAIPSRYSSRDLKNNLEPGLLKPGLPGLTNVIPTFPWPAVVLTIACYGLGRIFF